MKLFAIIGASASGKSELALSLARALECPIFSLDSLSIYREIDIASAKPSPKELSEVRHFGINLLAPYERSNAALFVKEFHKALEESQNAGKAALILAGGTGFFLKAILEGLSPTPILTQEHQARIGQLMSNPAEAFAFLKALDPHFCARLSAGDSHRIRRGIEIYVGSGIIPTEWFRLHPPKPLEYDIPTYNIMLEREILLERIKKRTEGMIARGLIDEVRTLESRYTRAPQAMKSIGILETLAYLDGTLKRDELAPLITTHTAQLAKRQTTFNKTQLRTYDLRAGEIFEAILRAMDA